MSTTSVTVRMNTDLKRQAEILFDSMGLNMTTAISLFAKAVVRQNKIPFEITADPFYCESNMARLKESIANLNAGKGIERDIIEVSNR
ncbi:MAG: type II toxin-antitoxin system RelB/DinJ family antitoxin [Defluviitaleaceae bacterium]|nr:type II toxin-antitoxin system RelB/DinJ family antitoxin [Defluviitaleaceae bacterium]